MHSADYGFWDSPLQPRALVRLRELKAAHGSLYWIETRPQEGGRQTLMLRSPEGVVTEILPLPYSARTRVHEYGGGAYAVGGDSVFFICGSDNSLRRLDVGRNRVTAIAVVPGSSWADLEYDPHRSVLWAVEEQESISTRGLVRLPVTPGGSPVRVLQERDHFFCAPRLSPDGQTLAWIRWKRPFMPWDQSELWTARVTPDGTLVDPKCAICLEHLVLIQPEWSSDGELCVIADTEDLGAVYTVRGDRLERRSPSEGEVFVAQWVFGQTAYALTPSGTTYTVQSRDGVRSLWREDTKVDVDLTDAGYLTPHSDGVAFLGSSFTESTGVWISTSQETRCVWRPDPIPRELASVPTAEHSKSGVSYFFYPPHHPQILHSAEPPPAIVLCHGGPTASAGCSLDLGILFWTTRGFAVVEVNYRGSTGFGRRFRQSLLGQWGRYDVEDCGAVAGELLAAKRIDPKACFIRGSSSGGLTVLRALMSAHSPFAAGVGYYPVTDLLGLAEQTHGFEYDYIGRLVGDDAELTARSPLAHADQISRPLLLLHGSEDRVVPPDQSQRLAQTLRAAGKQCDVVLFEEEGHGFRKQENVKAALEAELAFYRSFLNPPKP